MGRINETTLTVTKRARRHTPEPIAIDVQTSHSYAHTAALASQRLKRAGSDALAKVWRTSYHI